MSSPKFQSQQGWSVAQASEDTRTEFIHKTYQHLALAIAAFIGLEALLLNMPGVENLVGTMLGGRFTWLIVLGGFMLISRVAEGWARSTESLGMQYAGLGLYVVAEAIIFVPLMYMASAYSGPDVIAKAGLVTGITFGGLTAMVLVSKKDFSFMRGILGVMGFSAMGLIVVSLVFGMSLGSWFAWAMAVFAAGVIVYQTSNIVNVYRPGQHVAAALGLFASVALLFWYITQIFMNGDD
jgi:FtsH-binding integral membrane protein